MSTNNSWISSTETGLLTQGLNLKTQITDHQVELGLTNAEVLELKDLVDDFELALGAKSEAETTYRSSVISARGAQSALKAIMSALNKDVQANESVDDALKAKVGFPVYKKPTRGAPSIPTGLTAALEGESTAFLRWNRNGNPSSAIFTIEMKVGSGAWTSAGSTTASRWRIDLGSPGTQTSFRIKARRGDIVSAPSTSVTLWTGESNSFIQLAA